MAFSSLSSILRALRRGPALWSGALLAGALATGAALAEPAKVEKADVDVEAASDDGIRYFNAEDVPTFKINENGELDWPSFSGYRRYHAECHVCHGPDGEGSTYAPALKNSAIRMDYYDFIGTVASGRQKVGAAENQVMPAFGVNPNVMCYLDDIYIYLRARGTEAIPRGRPPKKEAKSDAYAAAEKSCMEG